MPEADLAGWLVTFDSPAVSGDLWNGIVAFGIFFGILYFVALRPQAQEKKAHEEMIASLAKDDLVVTGSGIHGKIVEVGADTIVLEIAEKTRVKVDRSAISRKAGAPAPEKK
jgi:preprotein translocase subunit YajC